MMCCFCGRLRRRQGGTLTFWQQLGSRVQRLTGGMYARLTVQQVKVGSELSELALSNCVEPGQISLNYDACAGSPNDYTSSTSTA